MDHAGIILVLMTVYAALMRLGPQRFEAALRILFPGNNPNDGTPPPPREGGSRIKNRTRRR